MRFTHGRPRPRERRAGTDDAPGQDQALLQLEDLHVSHGRVRAVRGVNLDVHAGELVALVGPNGAGKSSLLSGIMGWARSSGTARFAGASLRGLPTEQIVRRGISLVPEGRRVFGSLTVEENLRLATSALPDKHTATAAIEQEMTRFPALARLRDRTASTLSGGEQQQVSIARALVTRPTLLMLDEPSFGLAPLVVEHVMQIVQDLSKSGVTILLVEQNAVAAVEIADRAYSMRNGELESLTLAAGSDIAAALGGAFFGRIT